MLVKVHYNKLGYSTDGEGMNVNTREGKSGSGPISLENLSTRYLYMFPGYQALKINNS